MRKEESVQEGEWLPGARCCFLTAALVLFLSRFAAAQIPSTSPTAIGNVPAAQPPDGTTSTIGLATGVDLMKLRDGEWVLRDNQIRTDFLLSVSAWNRVALDVAVPLLIPVDANHVALGPIFLGGGIALKPRPAGARGVAVALRVGSDLPLHDVFAERFETDLGVAVDVLLSRNILFAAYAGLGASARYGLKDPAFQSFRAGAGLRVPLGDHLDLLATLSGRLDAFGGPSVRGEASAGLRLRIGHVFLTGTIGMPLTEAGLLFHLVVHAGTGDGLLPPAEREDVVPPEDLCFETSCTPQQRAAVRRAIIPHIEEIRKKLVALAALVELRIREKAGASAGRDALHLTITNDLSIPGDADRKRELSVRFLLAAFARGGIPIDRAMAAQLLDDAGWQVQVGREIGEVRVDYFTFDMPRLHAAYVDRLRWNAEHLADAIKALRAADAGTTEILLDIARGHANGLIAVTNGLLDLPLAPLNLGLFLAGRETIHGLGRIPHVEYKSDWGHRFGGAMELGVALGTMTAPGASVFSGLGRTIAPAVNRLDELSKLIWNGLPVGKFLQAILVKWMQGSVLAVKAHAAADMGAIIEALVTRRIRMPDGTYREMTADDFEQLVSAFILDAAVAKAAMEGERGIEEEPLPERKQQRGEGKGIRPPKPRLPKDGTWSGEEGNSFFKPNNPEKLGLGPDEVIEFVDGRPNFSPWAVEEFEVPGMNGFQKHDNSLIKRTIAEREGLLKRDGTPNADAANRWLNERDLLAHHAKGYFVQLIPRRLHEVVRHTGGAYDLRQRGK